MEPTVSTPLRFFPAILLGLSASALAQRPPSPTASVQSWVDTTLGDIRTDNYFWLRDRKNPDVIKYLQAENEYTAASMKHTEGLQEQLYREMLGRIKETDLSVPERDGGYLYYQRTEKGKQYPIYCRKKASPNAREEILLDANELATGLAYFDVGVLQVSPDHRLLAYSTDTSGSETYTLYVKDLVTGKLRDDRVPNVYYSVEWANDNRTIFYTTVDSAKRPHKLLRHALGTSASNDAELYHEPNQLFDVDFEKSRSDEYLLLTTGSYSQSEVRYLSADRPMDSLRLVAPRQADVLYSVTPREGSFYILTNEGASNFKVMRAPASNPSKPNWTPFIAHSDSVLISSIEAFKDYLVFGERRGALRRLRIMDATSGESHDVSFPEPVYTVYLANNPEYETRTLRFTYMSMVTPGTVYDYDMKTRSRAVRKRTEVPGYDPSLYRAERTWARASDGTLVPVSLVYRLPLIKDGSRPMLLYAYGSYGSSQEAAFSSNIISLLDRGVVYALAHIRGGQEMGRAWYDQGKLLNKKNTFTDFIASAEHLVREKYTSSNRLAIRGGSAGGLLMGAVVNMRPDLFKAVVADVPFVDVITTMKDASIPLTAQEWEQWGDPRQEKFYAYMKSYSPYDNVSAKAYPTMLVTTGLNDPRVPYWEPAKWVAKLRATKTDDNVLILKTNMGAGHGGASGRYDALREQAFRYAFILDALGIAGDRRASR